MHRFGYTNIPEMRSRCFSSVMFVNVLFPWSVGEIIVLIPKHDGLFQN
jgi:hypothetical protein